MKQYAIGLTILSALAVASGCTDEPSQADETPMGKAEFGLTAPGGFSLDAQFTLTNTGDATVTPVDTTSVPDEDTSISVDLAPGSYDPAMGTWSLTGPGIDGTATDGDTTDNVAFINFSQDPFTVESDVTTGVALLFTVSGLPVTIVPGDGNATFTALVSSDCIACAAGEICASVAQVNGGDPTCITPCDPTPVDGGGDECTAPAACVEATGLDAGGFCFAEP